MTVEKIANANSLTFVVGGRMDTASAPLLENEIKAVPETVDTLVFDFVGLDYLSSAGLRVLLQAQKLMNKQGKMIIKNINETVAEIFEVTGFFDILTIE